MRPTLQTDRLILRPFEMADAKTVQKLAGHELIAATTATVPHPYEDGMAESWISQHEKWFSNGQGVQFAIVLKETKQLIGCIDISDISKSHKRGEIGYWIGVDYWNKGFCSEALAAVLQYGFEKLNLNKLVARHLDVNVASGKVMLKNGMKLEGILRHDRFKNGRFADVHVYGLLREENS